MENGRSRKMNFIEKLTKWTRNALKRVAFVDREGDRSVSYSAFASLVRRVNTKLNTMNLKKGDFLLINMGRCYEYIAAYYGAIMAGFAVVPIVPDYPEERISYIRENCAAPFMITEEFFSDIDTFEETDRIDAEPLRTVCMNYTSGSTGKPKGVYYTFRCLDENIRRAATLYDGTDKAIVASSASFSFAAFCHDCLGAFYSGATVHIMSDRVRHDVHLTEQYYETHGIEHGNISPAMLKFFHHTKGLKRIFTTGERVVDIYSDEHKTYCVYGLTEAYTAVSYFIIDKKYKNTPIGKPFAGEMIEILDENGNEVPDGQEGEIFVTGFLAEGYYKMPEATEKVFRRLSDGRMRFDTHDVGYRNENGDIVYVNRKDWMVKINGQRVEPFEIEAVIRGMPQIQSCVIKDFETDGKVSLAAYYIAEDPSVTPEMIRNAAAKKLPPYMIPSYYIKMDSFPLTVSGKIDKLSLPNPTVSVRQRSTEYEAPANEKEAKVCHAMESVLGVERVGRKDDFFALGADSIAVMALIAEIGDGNLLVSQIRESKTPEKIARCLSGEIPYSKEEREKALAGFYPLTEYQKHYYAFCTFCGEPKAGSIPSLLQFKKGTYPAQKIAEAAYQAFVRHPAVSMVFTADGKGEIMQHADPSCITVPETIELTEEQFLSGKNSLICGFDLKSGPLYRCAVYSTEQYEYLYLEFHHIIADSGALDLMAEDILKILHGEETEPDDYFLYLKSLNQSRATSEVLDLSGYDRHPHYDAEPDSDTSTETRMLAYTLPWKTEEFIRLMEKRKTSPLDFLLAAALKAESACNVHSKVMANWIYSGRDSHSKNRMFGLLLKAFPVAVDAEGMTEQELLEEIFRQNQEKMRKPEVFFGFGTARPLLDDVITVNYIPYKKTFAESAVKRIDLLNNNKAKTNTLYVIYQRNAPNQIAEILIKYNTALYTEKSIRRFYDVFKREIEENATREEK